MEKTRLEKYTKNKKTKREVTSVNLEPRHKVFLEKNNLNLSALIRDFLDSLIKEEGK